MHSETWRNGDPAACDLHWDGRGAPVGLSSDLSLDLSLPFQSFHCVSLTFYSPGDHRRIVVRHDLRVVRRREAGPLLARRC